MQNNYERKQNFNVITRTLHKTRYRNLLALFTRITAQVGGRPIKVIDVGCGVCKSFAVLNAQFSIDYTGIELRAETCDLARSRHGDIDGFEVICDSVENHFPRFDGADVVIGLESFEHIPEPIVVRTLEAIRAARVPYFYCTVPNEVGPAILIKNVGSWLMRYPRYKEYTWAETWHAFRYDLDKVTLHTTKHIGFDWRWLAQTIRQNVRITQITTSPFRLVPRSWSPSIGFVCERRDDGAP